MQSFKPKYKAAWVSFVFILTEKSVVFFIKNVSGLFMHIL